MNDALAIFNALRSFARPATRAELEREAGLTYHQAHQGLKTLLRHGLLIKDTNARMRGTYELVQGAQMPQTKRGRYDRRSPHRPCAPASAHQHHAVAPTYSAAMPPSHSAAPGALRTVVKGVLDLNATSGSAFAPCALAQAWRKRG